MAIEPIRLPREHIEMLRKLGEDLAVMESEIARAERAGIDVSDLKRELERIRNLRDGILREYGTETV